MPAHVVHTSVNTNHTPARILRFVGSVKYLFKWQLCDRYIP